ncbi:MAG: hypothetical protein R3220_12490 [Balneolaceae bacterium]|nr:hypothetical protein [Balneolaceae bacterium]
MKAVERIFILNKQVNNNTAGNAKCQPKHIDKAVKFALLEVSKSDFYVVFEHCVLIVVSCS